VNLASGATLAVTNSLDAHGAPAPLVVTQAPHPYEDSCYFMFSNNSSGTCSFQPIPSGQRLVIQEVDAFMGLDTGLRPTTFYLNTALVHYFTVTVMGTNVGGYDYFATHQETHLYVNGGGSAPLCAVFLSGNSFGGNFHCALTGYLENVP
jgi:hypothetical protein